MLQKVRRVQQACKDIRDGELEEDLGRQELRPDDLKDLCDEVARARKLQKLSLFDNMLGAKGMELVSDMLRANISLVDIELSANAIGDKGVATICDALKTNRMLIRVGLGGNGINDAGAKSVADMLMVNNHLQVLDFQFNNIGAEGARHMAEALRTNHGLLELIMGGNSIGDEGARALGGAIRLNVHLIKLELPTNGIGEDGARALADGLKLNESMQALTLDDDAISKELMREIRDRLRKIRAQAESFAANGLAALQRNDKARWGRAKLTVLGEAGSGKSALVRALLGQPPLTAGLPDPLITRQSSTFDAADIPEGHVGRSTMRVETSMVRDWQLARTSVSDLCEQLAKHQFRPQSLGRRVNQATFGRASNTRKSTGTSRKAREKQQQQQQQASSQRSLRRGASQRLRKAIGRKSPPTLYVDEQELAERYSSTLKTRVESKGVAVDTEVTFTVWDFSGRELFYNMHHLFLTQFGAFVVTFDMAAMQGDPAGTLAGLQLWLDSIKLHAPSADAVIVGTRMDQVGDRAAINKISDALMTGLQLAQYRTVPNRGQRLRFFPVDCNGADVRDSPQVEAIREAVAESVRGKSYVTRQVPLRWMLLLDLMFADAAGAFMPMAAVRALAHERCGIPEAELENDMLPYMHELGVLINFSATPAMSSRVVLRPQWLLDELSRAVCEPEEVSTHREDIYFGEGFPGNLEAALDRWRDQGVAERALLEWLWRDADFATPARLAPVPGGGGSEADQSESMAGSSVMGGAGANFDATTFFSAVLEQSLVGSPWPGDPSAMLLPALLPSASEEQAADLAMDFAGGPVGFVQMDFLPRGAFQRLVCALASLMEEQVSVSVHKVFADLALLNLGGAEMLLQSDPRAKRVVIRFRRADGEAGLVGDRVGQLNDVMPSAAAALRFGGRLQPRLLLCTDNSQRDDVSALVSKILASRPKRAVVQSVSDRAIPFEAFKLFFPRV